jgi:hypothetical protein
MADSFVEVARGGARGAIAARRELAIDIPEACPGRRSGIEPLAAPVRRFVRIARSTRDVHARDVGRPAKVSRWIASDRGWLIAVAARAGRTSVLLDTEARRALGLEAYGEILRGGDVARVDAALREL